MTTAATAPGKAILFGEHAVVYGHPAIAVPLPGVAARAEVSTLTPCEDSRIVAQDLGRVYAGQGGAPDDEGRFLQAALAIVLREQGLAEQDVALAISVRSDIPIARGLGSGAAVAAALMRAVSTHLGSPVSEERLSTLVFQTEQLLHGRPSGIDNTTVVLGRPVWFVPGTAPEPLAVGCPLSLIVGDTGVPSRTRDSVSSVRRRLEADPQDTAGILSAIGAIAAGARQALAAGRLDKVGQLMDDNHDHLKRLGVSSPELDRLVCAARGAGALGAKLSGGGMGGCMIALTRAHATAQVAQVAQALVKAGAAGVYLASVGEKGTG
ncbi:MAG: mevalonate kinase [Anaerolineae bacterium]|nr:mevalonate kinase [Chloroflexota bacterium]